MEKFNEKQIEILEDNFNYYEDENTIELEKWTDGGVDMFINIHKDDNTDYLQQLKDYVENFDIDEEIELHRQDERYKKAFTIRQSLEDFTDFVEELKNIIILLEREV